MFVYLKKLYDSDLYSNVLPIGGMIISAYKRDRSILTPEQYFLTLMYYGNSLMAERHHRKAEGVFIQALLAKKLVTKLKSTYDLDDSGTDLFPESEIRYRLAFCLEATRQIQEAIEILKVIPSKQRVPKVNMLLSKLYLYNSYDKNAIAPLKAVLKECPLNLQAIEGLISLGVKVSEIIATINENGFSAQCSDWLHNYVITMSQIYASKFSDAINTLKAIEAKTDVGNSEMILVLIGQCHHYMGNHDTALHYLELAYNSNENITDCAFTLASLYAIKNKLDDLEKLTMPTMALSEYTAENWFVLAQHLFCQGKYDKAAYFAQKSCYLKPKNAEATLLKIKIFMNLKKYKDAIGHLRILQQFAPYRFEVYEGLVDAYIATNRLREAQEISRAGVRRQGTNISARSYVLLAKPYYCLEEAHQKAKARSLLIRALDRDEYYLPAVLIMVDILQEAGDTVGATQLLKKQVAMQPNSKLYSMLGDILSKDKDQTKAVEYYTVAINMDPTNRKAVAGLIAMGQSFIVKNENAPSYASSAQTTNDGTSTDYQENAFEMVDIPAVVTIENESESDALWSDVEIEVHNG